MTDQKILKYYLNPEPERKRLGTGYGQFYVIRERMSPFGREAYYLVFRSTRAVQFEEISKQFYHEFRMEADRWRKGFTNFRAPDGDGPDELIRYYISPEAVRQKEQGLVVTQFYLLRCGRRCYLGRRSMWECQVHYTTPDFYERTRDEVLRRAKELNVEHWVTERTIENPDERLLADDPVQRGWILKPADTTANSVPVHRKHPESYHEESGKACWCWRKKVGGSPPPDEPPF